MVLEFLLRRHARTGDAEALRMARGTLEAMARGGIYDQLAGGFARYSVDAQWVVPHFEKMLYDNALLLRVYLHLWRATGDEWARRVADETAAFLIRDLGTPEGGFASALDADTDGVEGLTYVWTPAQLVEVLGRGRRALGGGAVRGHRRGHLRARRLDVAATARTRRRRPVRVRAAATARRPGAAAPARAGRQGGHRLERPGDRGPRRTRGADRRRGARWPRPARRPSCWPGRTGSTAGSAGPPGTASPAGTPGSSRTTAIWPRDCWHCTRRPAEGRWLELAGDLLDVVAEQFIDIDGWHDTAADAEALVHRPFDPADGPTPAGIAAAAGAAVALRRAGRLTAAPGTGRGGAVLAGRGWWSQAPRAAGWAAAVGEALLAGPLEVAVSGPAGPERDALAAAARASTSPGAVVVVGNPDAPGVPLLAGPARRRRAARPPTSAGDSSARPRSPTCPL